MNSNKSTLMNRTQARKYFDRHCFLIDSHDVVDAVRTGEMFGDEAVLYAIHGQRDNKQTALLCDTGKDKQRVLLTYEGFEQVITYRNMEIIMHYEKVSGLKKVEAYKVNEKSKVISFQQENITRHMFSH